jgi:hypothetical protein
MLLKLRHWFSPRQEAEPPTFIQVSNLTRKTVIATSVEVADSGSKRNRGLLGRTGLAPGEGLWIVPCESVHTIGMKFPIDLIYLDRKLRIKKLRSDVGPWRMSACLSAHSVLELACGAIRNTQVRKGDQLALSTVPPPLSGAQSVSARNH